MPGGDGRDAVEVEAPGGGGAPRSLHFPSAHLAAVSSIGDHAVLMSPYENEPGPHLSNSAFDGIVVKQRIPYHLV